MRQAAGAGDDGTLVIVWRYRVSDEHAAAFVRAYGPDGDWARLFATAAGYLGTELAGGEAAGQYATIDRWESPSHWEAFMAEHGAEYERLDAEFADLLDSEELVVRGRCAQSGMPG